MTAGRAAAPLPLQFCKPGCDARPTLVIRRDRSTRKESIALRRAGEVLRLDREGLAAPPRLRSVLQRRAAPLSSTRDMRLAIVGGFGYISAARRQYSAQALRADHSALPYSARATSPRIVSPS